jgi:long-chain fatty acid transport protein
LTTPPPARALALACLIVAAASPAAAGSFYLQEQSVKGAGRAFSGEVADCGVASLWWNPASIACSRRELYLGVHGILLDSRVRDDGSTLTRPLVPGGLTTPVGGQLDNIDPVKGGVAPNFAVALPLNDRLVLGLSAMAPYNLSTEYNADSFTRYDALKSSVLTVDMQATLAARVTDWLDVGVGLSGEYVSAELTSALPNLAPGSPDGLSELEGDGIDLGWTVGARAHAGRWEAGLSYRSAIEHELEGDVTISGLAGPLAAANVDTAGTAAFTTPWIASAGVRFAVNDRLTLNAQVNRIGWSEFDAIRVAYDGGGDTIVQDYRDVTTGAVGLDYRVNDRVTVRAGVAWDPTPTRDERRTARIPDEDRRLYSVGATVRPREGLSVDAALTFIDIDAATIRDDRVLYAGTGADTVSRLRGEATGSGVVASLGARWAF